MLLSWWCCSLTQLTCHRSFSQIHVPLLVPSPGDNLKSLRKTELELYLDNKRILWLKVPLVEEVSCLGPSEPGPWWGWEMELITGGRKTSMDVGVLKDDTAVHKLWVGMKTLGQREKREDKFETHMCLVKERPNELFLAEKQPFFGWSKSLSVPLEKDAGSPIPS